MLNNSLRQCHTGRIQSQCCCVLKHQFVNKWKKIDSKDALIYGLWFDIFGKMHLISILAERSFSYVSTVNIKLHAY